MANKINYEIGFTTNKSSLNEIKKSLQEVRNLSAIDIQMKGENLTQAKTRLKEMKDTANELEMAINQAFNPTLNNFNTDKLKSSLDKIGIPKIQKQFKNLGTTGTQAFRNIAMQIATADVQLEKTTTLADKMFDTFKKTASWGISSSVFNNLTSAIQKSWNYTEKLDKSLTNIRVVSGQSADQMERFAKQANKAAKELGSTTQQYADAALIFYQQGLSGDDVTKRTDVVIKMANVTRDAADDVSSYMTAIWNNFNDGSESIEHYADVITALGASTASSSSEIAEGLEKFAAVADTVGLSYEYATSALATVVAATRQSADTVGTAFKTLFARIEGLSLGETLDDGTTLTKYSKALETVGINIKTQNGEMKDMNTILDEMGSKWQTLNKDQQLALAQTVAGTRQYNQLVALMENWSTMQANLNTANNASGTLEKQQKIYEESIEAAEDRLQAAAEGFYNAFYDSDSMKNLINALTKIVELADQVTQSIGGGGNLLLMIFSTLASKMSGQIASSLTGIGDKLKKAAVDGEKVSSALDFTKYLKSMGLADKELEKIIKHLEKMYAARKSGLINDEDVEKVKGVAKDLGEVQSEFENYQDEMKNSSNILKQLKDSANKKGLEGFDGPTDFTRKNSALKNLDGLSANAYEEKTTSITKDLEKRQGAAKNLQTEMSKLSKAFADYNKADTEKNQQKLQKAYDNTINKLKELQKQYDLTEDEELELAEILKDASKEGMDAIDGLTDDIDKLTSHINTNNSQVFGTLNKEANGTFANLKNNIEILEQRLTDFENKLKKAFQSEGFVQLASGLGQVASSIYAIKNLGNIWTEEDLSITEKLLQTTTMLPTAFVTAKNGLTTMKTGAQGLAVSLGIVEDAEAAAKMSTKELGSAIMSELGISLPVVLAVVAAIAAAVATTVYVVKTLKNNAERSERTLTNMADGAASALEKATEASNNFKNSLSGYESATNSLAGLTKGTLEYAEAVAEANTSARELIDTWGLTAGKDYSLDSSGKININQSGLDTINQELSSQMYSAMSMSSYAKATQLKEADLKSVYKDLATDINNRVVKENNNYNRTNNTTDAKTLSDANKNNFNEVGQKITSKFSLITESQTKALLESPGIDTALMSSISDPTKDVLDVTKEISKHVDDYNETMLKIIEEERASADAAFRANASESDIVQYDKYTQKQQTILQDYLNNERDRGYSDRFAIAANAEEYSMWGSLGALLVDSSIIGAIFNKVNHSGFLDKTAQYATATELKTQYATNKMGWTQTSDPGFFNGYNGKFVDSQGKTHDLSEIDLGEAQSYFISNEKIAKPILANLNKTIDEIAKSEDYKKLTKDSQDYVAEGITAALTYKSDAINKYDYSILSQDELDVVTEYLNKTGEYNDLLTKLKNNVSAVTQEERALARAQEDKNRYYQVLDSNAESLGTTSETLDAFGYGVQQATGENYSQSFGEKTAELYNFNKTFNEGIEIYKNNLEGYNEWRSAIGKKIPSVGASQAVGEITTQLKQMGINLTNDQLASKDTAKALEKLFTGTEKDAEKAYKTLKKYSIKNTLEELNTKYKLQIDTSEMENIAQTLSQLSPGENFSDEMQQQLINMVNSANLTKDKLDSIFSNLGISYDTAGLEEITKQGRYTYRQLADTGQVIVDDAIKNICTMYNSMEEAQKATSYDITKEDFTIPGTKIKHTVTMPVDPKDKNNKETYQYTYYDEQSSSKQSVVHLGAKANLKTTSTGFSSFTKNPSGSSSSGGSSSKKKKDISELDRYEKVNTRLGKISSTLSGLQRQESNLKGPELLDNLNQQLALLDSQLDTTNEKLKIAENEMAETRNTLANTFGAVFTEDGQLANYAEIYTRLINEYNAAVDKGNETRIEAAEETLNKFTDLYKRYDELWSNEVPELSNTIAEDIVKKLEIKFKTLEVKLNASLDLSEARKNWSDFLKEMADDDDLGAQFNIASGAMMSQITSGAIEAYNERIKETLQEIADMEAQGIGGEALSMAQDKLKEYQQGLQEVMTAYKTNLKELQDYITQMYDKTSEYMSKQIGLYDHVNSSMNHAIKLLQIKNGNTNYGDLTKYYEKIQQISLVQYNAQQSNADYWAKQMELVEKSSTEWESARDKWLEAVSASQSALESYLDAVTNKYTNTISDIFDSLVKEMAGASADYLDQEWEILMNRQDNYLNNLDKEYNIQKLANSYTKEINSTSSLSAQQKLNKAREEELKLLKEKDKLTQYDIDRAEKKLELIKAQIALDEAQKNKSTLRLRRDSQGNYSYVYGANEDDILDKQQAVADAQYNLAKADQSEITNIISNFISDYKAWQDEIASNPADAAIINQKYKEKVQGYASRIGEIIANAQNSGGYLSAESLMQDLSALQSGYLSTLLSFESEDSLNKFIENIMAASNKYSTDTAGAIAQGITNADSTITSVENMATAMATTIADSKSLVADAQATVNKLSEQIDAWGQLTNSMQTLTVAQTALDALLVKQLGGVGGNVFSGAGEAYSELIAALSSQDITPYTPSLNTYSTAAIRETITSGSTPGALEQQIHIEASFPGVSSAREIEDAFINLENRVSQYINALN